MRNLDCVTEKWASLIVPGKVIDGVEEVEQYFILISSSNDSNVGFGSLINSQILFLFTSIKILQLP